MNEIPEFAHGALVHFVYLAADGENDREFNAWCDFLPPVGSFVSRPGAHPKLGTRAEKVIVNSIYHSFVRANPESQEFHQVVTVVLRDQDAGVGREGPTEREPEPG